MTEKYITRVEFDTFREQVRVWLNDMLGEIAKLQRTDGFPEDEPGIAPRQPRGKALQGRKYDLRVRVDKNLADALIRLAKKNHGGNISRALDVLLWRYFDRPKLTWEDKK
jgi:hypothetical protein